MLKNFSEAQFSKNGRKERPLISHKMSHNYFSNITLTEHHDVLDGLGGHGLAGVIRGRGLARDLHAAAAVAPVAGRRPDVDPDLRLDPPADAAALLLRRRRGRGRGGRGRGGGRRRDAVHRPDEVRDRVGVVGHAPQGHGVVGAGRLRTADRNARRRI